MSAASATEELLGILGSIKKLKDELCSNVNTERVPIALIKDVPNLEALHKELVDCKEKFLEDKKALMERAETEHGAIWKRIESALKSHGITISDEDPDFTIRDGVIYEVRPEKCDRK